MSGTGEVLPMSTNLVVDLLKQGHKISVRYWGWEDNEDPTYYIDGRTDRSPDFDEGQFIQDLYEAEQKGLVIGITGKPEYDEQFLLVEPPEISNYQSKEE
jgi:hypothetical protein